jgi:hypothetical protein
MANTSPNASLPTVVQGTVAGWAKFAPDGPTLEHLRASASVKPEVNCGCDGCKRTIWSLTYGVADTALLSKPDLVIGNVKMYCSASIKPSDLVHLRYVGQAYRLGGIVCEEACAICSKVIFEYDGRVAGEVWERVAPASAVPEPRPHITQTLAQAPTPSRDSMVVEWRSYTPLSQLGLSPINHGKFRVDMLHGVQHALELPTTSDATPLPLAATPPGHGDPNNLNSRFDTVASPESRFDKAASPESWVQDSDFESEPWRPGLDVVGVETDSSVDASADDEISGPPSKRSRGGA